MRYNEKELQALSRQPAELAAELGMRGPKKGSVVKRRLVKLVVNFLFYFRTDEAEPVGALLLEHCRVTQEEPSDFSIWTLQTTDPELVRDGCAGGTQEPCWQPWKHQQQLSCLPAKPASALPAHPRARVPKHHGGYSSGDRCHPSCGVGRPVETWSSGMG
ncbi:PREDICTED: pleckstrin homology domain-containing family J member 1 isoform X1 [Hipposideros armiger]|uniref:Pleckstrin homology domain-containing family J member 1 isoform X1 n=1 Tax=Hipposideros armiger TaxID=186990 RepID=A0A8B7SJN5_HIPAR|nr:PREDICTED: pleckstrin homology domain-containing family J member 1 isoform X1 [Hipposideros armiger]